MTARLTAEREAEIRARMCTTYCAACADTAELLAELDAVRAENSRLRARLVDALGRLDTACETIGPLRDQVEVARELYAEAREELEAAR